VDIITINQSTASGLTLDGQGSGDEYRINLVSLAGAITITESNNGPGDRAIISGSQNADVFNITGQRVTANGVAINYASGGLESLRINGGLADDTYSVSPSATTPIIVDGGPENLLDRLSFNGLTAPVTITSTVLTASGFQPVTYVAMETILVNNASGPYQFLGLPQSSPGVTDVRYHYVQDLYFQALGRLGSQGELDSWVAQLPALGRSGVATQIFRSGEALGRVVDRLYIEYLNRRADPGSKSLWVGEIAAGRRTIETVANALLASPEFANRANTLFNTGNPDTNYIQALFSLLLRRRPSDGEVNFWLARLSSVGREEVANGFTTSFEFRNAAIHQLYGEILNPFVPFVPDLLHRISGVSMGEANGWNNSGRDLLAIEIIFASTDEFFLNA